MDEEKKEEKEIIEVEKIEPTRTEETTAKTEEKVVTEPKKDRKGFCIASMVLGIIALLFFCIWYLSIPCAILAIIFGVLGVKSKGKGMAIAGLVTGAIGLFISICIIIFIFIFGVALGISEILDDDYEYNNSYNYRYRNSDWYDFD